MSLPRDEAWFPVKTYGWGWGLPSRWQGWVVLLTYVAFVGAGALWWAAEDLTFFLVAVTCASAALVAICAWKGEKPRWRWGPGE